MFSFNCILNNLWILILSTYDKTVLFVDKGYELLLILHMCVSVYIVIQYNFDKYLSNWTVVNKRFTV